MLSHTYRWQQQYEEVPQPIAILSSALLSAASNKRLAAHYYENDHGVTERFATGFNHGRFQLEISLSPGSANYLPEIALVKDL